KLASPSAALGNARFCRSSPAHASQYQPAKPPHGPTPPNWNKVLTVALDDGRSAEPRVQRVALSDRRRTVGEIRSTRIEVVLAEGLGDDHADLDEVLELQAAGGQCRRADAQPA